MKKSALRSAVVALALAAALLAASSAKAATIDDLKALGFSVGVAFEATPGCNVYSISGYGVSVYANPCTPEGQSVIDSLADPAAQCNRVWQYAHPDQLSAFQTISSKGYGITGNQCGDSYTVSAPGGAVVYQGSGAGLVQLASTLPAAPVGTQPGVTPPSQCLPLCATPTPGGGDPVDPGSGTTQFEPGFTLSQLIAATSRILQPGEVVFL